LVISILAFIAFGVLWFDMLGSLHMDDLLDFFVIIASLGIYSYYMAIALIVGIGAAIATIILGILRR